MLGSLSEDRGNEHVRKKELQFRGIFIKSRESRCPSLFPRGILKLEETNVFVTSEIYSYHGDFYFTGNLNIGLAARRMVIAREFVFGMLLSHIDMLNKIRISSKPTND